MKDKINQSLSLGEDYILFDAYSENEYGGTGKSFDLNLIKILKEFSCRRLNNNNLEQAIKNIKSFLCNLSSGVETDNRKDFNKIKEVIDAVKFIKIKKEK